MSDGRLDGLLGPNYERRRLHRWPAAPFLRRPRRFRRPTSSRPALTLASWPAPFGERSARGGLGRRLLLENLCPVELDLRVALLDRPDRRFIQRRAANLDPGRRAEPIQDAGADAASTTVAVDDEGVLVAAFVAAEAQIRQDYFLFCAGAGLAAVRAARAGRDAVFRGGAAFRAAGRLAAARAGAAARGVAVREVVRGLTAARSAAARLAGAGFGSATGLVTSGALR